MKSATPTTTTRRPSGTVKALATALGITTRQVATLLRQGMPDAPDAAIQWRKQQAGTAGTSADRLREQRILLVKSQRAKIEFENAVAAGEYLKVGDVYTSTLRIVTEAKTRFLRLPHELPPVLEGLSAPQIQRHLHGAMIAILDELSDAATYEGISAPG